jgi:pyruvate formate lyase activating enzyme
MSTTGRVFDLQRCSVHDGPGLRTTVFLAGCPLRCAWCHNPEAFKGETARAMTPQAVLDEVRKDRAFYDATGGGLTVSGGEPLLQPAFVREVLSLAKAEGLHTCVQTSAAVPQAALLEVKDLVDLFQVDVKHLDPARHAALTGLGNERVLENARQLVAWGARVEFRLPLVPGFTDDAENLGATARFLSSLGVHALTLVPYQHLYLGKYRALGLEARCASVVPPSPAALGHAAQQLARHGVTAAVAA